MKNGALSWHIGSDSVDAWMTVRGAQIAPVTFHLPEGAVEPYSLAPWEPGSIPDVPPLLDALRGDFLCLPFGAQPNGPQHGMTASAEWSLVESQEDSISVSLEATDIGASVRKTVSVRSGHTALYQEFQIVGLDGEFNYGTHPILDFTSQAPGGARISTSPLRWASTNAGVFSDPAAGETQVLQVDATFTSLDAIPRADGGTLDMSHYPTTPGHEDLVMLVADPDAGPVAWSAASFDGYTWFSLKDVGSFPATLLWISNGGRTQAPWNSVHTARLGIEDVCSYFADGLEASRSHPLEGLGIPTTRNFARAVPVTLRSVQAVTATPPGFGRVNDIDLTEPGFATLTDDAGTSVSTAVDWAYALEPRA